MAKADAQWVGEMITKYPTLKRGRRPNPSTEKFWVAIGVPMGSARSMFMISNKPAVFAPISTNPPELHPSTPELHYGFPIQLSSGGLGVFTKVV